MWRPDDWKNPDKCLCELDWVKAMGECGDMRYHSFEDGADAMLEALRLYLVNIWEHCPVSRKQEEEGCNQ